MISRTISIAKCSILEGWVLDEGCPLSVHCPATGLMYFIKVPRVGSTSTPADNTLSSTANSGSKKLKYPLINCYKHV